MFSSNTSAVSGDANYIEDVFSTYLYTGNAPSSQSITNGIDLAGKGGLVWLKNRSVGTGIGNELYNTNVGAGKFLSSNNTNANTNTTAGGTTYGLSSFNSNGFTVNDNWSGENTNGQNIASWTFRKQPKFFDVVTWTGDGTVGRTIAHNLGSTPGCIIVKCTNNTTKWAVWHRSGTQSNRYGAFLNTTDTYTDTLTNLWGAAGGTPAMTSTSFSVGDAITTNDYFNTYVAYVFAHNAGGFGLTGTDNVISCGSFLTDSGGNATVNLGYEPQFVMWKASSTTGGWNMLDNMRGFTVGGSDALLNANSSSAETSIDLGSPTSTGFTAAVAGTNATYIYIAIRRGPMKVPTSGTSVFSPITYTGDGTTARDFTNFGMLPDFVMLKQRNGTEPNHVIDRLRGGGNYLVSSATQAESAYPVLSFDSMNGVNDLDSYFNASGATWVFEAFRRAPSFFDEVCYTGTGSARTINHNLGVAPELMIVKSRSNAFNWSVYNASIGATNYLYLNLTNASSAFSGFWNDTSPTASVFSVGGIDAVNGSGYTYVAYLFATCAGVSKVGSYTGNGSSLSINCGFTSGARFVLIKRTDDAGSWHVFDTVRGMGTGNDPYLRLDQTATEGGSAYDSISTLSSGFTVNQNDASNLNNSGSTYIYLAIA